MQTVQAQLANQQSVPPIRHKFAIAMPRPASDSKAKRCALRVTGIVMNENTNNADDASRLQISEPKPSTEPQVDRRQHRTVSNLAVAVSGPRYNATSGTIVHAQNESYVIAQAESCVIAESGSLVAARRGSRVEALLGSRVTAYEGSVVIAFPGSAVVAKAGCLVIAEPDAEVIAERNAKVRKELRRS
jgi:hypothetical protein